MPRRLILFLILVIVAALLVMLAFFIYQPRQLIGTSIDPPRAARDFTLLSDHGQVSFSDFRGKIVVLYFGYTFCPDICPASLAKANLALERLGADAEKVQVIMVSVDPERDTAEKLGEYVRRFNPGFVGLTGSETEIAAVAKEFGIYYAKQEVSSSAGYLVDHTASMLILNSRGQIREIWPYEIKPEQAAADLKILLRESAEGR